MRLEVDPKILPDRTRHEAAMNIRLRAPPVEGCIRGLDMLRQESTEHSEGEKVALHQGFEMLRGVLVHAEILSHYCNAPPSGPRA